MAEALNALRIAVLILDRKGRIRFANSSAERLLARSDGLITDGDGCCSTYVPSEEEGLHLVVDAAIVEGRAGAVSVSRSSGGPPYPILVQPLKRVSIGSASVAEACALYVTDPDEAVVVSVEAVSTMYGLTPAEARLAAALLRWPVLRDAAEELGITAGTARQVLKRVFRKTAAQSQTGLVMLLVNSSVAAVSSEPF